MPIKCPLMSRNLVIADDARLAAQLSCALSEPGRYLPVIEGPRMTRADSDAEIARRNNAASRIKPEAIFLAGLPDDTAAALSARFTPRHRSRLRRIVTSEDINGLHSGRTSLPPLTWGNDRIGIGLLKALRAKTSIAFEGPSLSAMLERISGRCSRSRHLRPRKWSSSSLRSTSPSHCRRLYGRRSVTSMARLQAPLCCDGRLHTMAAGQAPRCCYASGIPAEQDTGVLSEPSGGRNSEGHTSLQGDRSGSCLLQGRACPLSGI